MLPDIVKQQEEGKSSESLDDDNLSISEVEVGNVPSSKATTIDAAIKNQS
jgi:hypothetical protein